MDLITECNSYKNIFFVCVYTMLQFICLIKTGDDEVVQVSWIELSRLSELGRNTAVISARTLSGQIKSYVYMYISAERMTGSSLSSEAFVKAD